MVYPKKEEKDMTPKLRLVGLIDSFLIKINKLSLTKKKVNKLIENIKLIIIKIQPNCEEKYRYIVIELT